MSVDKDDFKETYDIIFDILNFKKDIKHSLLTKLITKKSYLHIDHINKIFDHLPINKIVSSSHVIDLLPKIIVDDINNIHIKKTHNML